MYDATFLWIAMEQRTLCFQKEIFQEIYFMKPTNCVAWEKVTQHSCILFCLDWMCFPVHFVLSRLNVFFGSFCSVWTGCVRFIMKVNVAFNAKLVEAVEKYPSLYNYKLKGYSNHDEVDQSWAKVAKEIRTTVVSSCSIFFELRIYIQVSMTTFHCEWMEALGNRK